MCLKWAIVTFNTKILWNAHQTIKLLNEMNYEHHEDYLFVLNSAGISRTSRCGWRARCSRKPGTAGTSRPSKPPRGEFYQQSIIIWNDYWSWIMYLMSTLSGKPGVSDEFRFQWEVQHGFHGLRIQGKRNWTSSHFQFGTDKHTLNIVAGGIRTAWTCRTTWTTSQWISTSFSQIQCPHK